MKKLPVTCECKPTPTVEGEKLYICPVENCPTHQDNQTVPCPIHGKPTPTEVPTVNYSHISHTHCWNQLGTPACGRKEHTQCCLCDMKLPTDICKTGAQEFESEKGEPEKGWEKGWENRFDKQFEGYWRGNAIPDEIKFFIRSMFVESSAYQRGIADTVKEIRAGNVFKVLRDNPEVK